MLKISIDMNLCRVCLKADVEMCPIDQNLAEKFHEITGLRVTPENGLPRQLCLKCNSRLSVAHDFRKDSIASENHLKDFIAKVNSEFQSKISVLEGKREEKTTDADLQSLLESNSVPEVAEEESSTEDQYEFCVNEVIEDCSQQMDLEEEQANMCMEVGEDFDNDIIEKIIEEDPMPSYDEVDDPSSFSKEDFSPEEETPSSDSKPINSRNSTWDSLDLQSHYCIKCGKDFSTKANLHRHRQTHDGQKPFHCSVCGKGFTQKTSLKQHTYLHSGERPYKCSFCKEAFTQAKTLTNHLRRHTGEKPFVCAECGMKFRQKDSLKRHQLRHVDNQSERGLFECNICHKKLLSKYTLSYHMEKHTRAQETTPSSTNTYIKYECRTCSKIFHSPKALEAHERSHNNETSFKCTYDNCAKVFIQQSALKNHLKTHENCTDIPNELVEIVEEIAEDSISLDSKFTLVESLKPPMDTSSSSRYPCNKCSKTFTLKKNLLIHVKNHSLTDNTHIFKCDDCCVGFTSNRSLKLHRRNQHQENVHDLNKCEECGVDFVSYVDLVYHISQKHDEIDTNCFFCGEYFQSKNLMTEHILEHEYNEEIPSQ